MLEAEAAAKALLGLPEDEVLAAEKGDGLMSAKSGDVFMGWSKSTHPATTEEGEAVDVGSTGCQSSYSPTCGPPTSPLLPPPSPELARVLDKADSLRKYHDEDDDITSSFEPMESDDAVEERTSRVEPIEDYASDGEDSVFDHEVEPLHAVEKTLRPIIFKSVLGSVIGREYTRCEIRGFVVSDLVSAMCDMSSTSFVDEIIDDIMKNY